MPLLDEEVAKSVAEHFRKNLSQPITIDYFTQRDSPLIIPGAECQYCRETRQILEELAALSPLITLNVHDFVGEADKAREMGIERIPAFEIRGQSKGRVRYMGIPAGYEFSSLIEDLVDVSRGRTALSDISRLALARIEMPVHIQVYVTPT